MKADQALSWTSHWDQALLAVAALKKPELIGSAYNSASLQAVTPIELAEIFGRQRGDLRLQFEAISAEQFAARVGTALNNPSLIFLLTDLYRAINQQSATQLIVDTDLLQKTFGVELKSVSQRIGAWSLSRAANNLNAHQVNPSLTASLKGHQPRAISNQT